MRFEAFTVSTTTIITSVTLIVTCSLAYAKLDSRLTVIEQIVPERLTRIVQDLQELRQDLKAIQALLAKRN